MRPLANLALELTRMQHRSMVDARTVASAQLNAQSLAARCAGLKQDGDNRKGQGGRECRASEASLDRIGSSSQASIAGNLHTSMWSETIPPASSGWLP